MPKAALRKPERSNEETEFVALIGQRIRSAREKAGNEAE